MKALLALALVLAAACSTTAAEPEPPAARPPCGLSIVALPPGMAIAEGEALPPGSRLIATPDDFDTTATTIGDHPTGVIAVTVHLRGPAVAEFAAHTAAHVGDFIAILLNGDVMTVPMIAEPIADGRIELSGGALDGQRFADRFAVCVS